MADKRTFAGVVVIFAIIFTGTTVPTVKYVQGEKKLRMVNMVYRHGDRSPTATFPADAHVNFWPQGLGQLTQKGMREEYQLGQFIKNRYITDNSLLNVSYIRGQVYCRSTDYDRTIMSAEAQMNGLYPPHGSQVWKPGVKWQPIPIHVKSKKEDELLIDSCPEWKKLFKESLDDPKYQVMKLRYQGLAERLNILLGYNRSDGIDFQHLYKVHDNFYCCMQHNLSLPSWANMTVMNTLKTISDFQMGWLYNNKMLASLFSGPLLGEMVQHMESFRTKVKDTKKIYIYSAHDTTVAGLLSVLGVYDGYAPPYSSAVMVELYSSETPGDDFSVRIFYRIGQNETPKQLVLKGCDPDCPLEQFIELTKNSIPKNRDDACGLKKGIFVQNLIYKSFLAAFAGTLVILIILIICACCCWCRYRRTVSRASRVNFDDGMLKDASLLENQDYDSE